MNGRSLMEHWKIVRLEEIADMRGGASFPKAYQGSTEGKYPFYKVSDMNIEGNETLMQASNNWVEEDTIEILRAKLFSKDTVIFPKVGAAVHTNKKRLLSCDSLVDNNVMGVTIRDCNLCIPYYLLYWFEFVDLGDFSNPGPLPSITVTTVKNAKIPLPPLPEQCAIAHILQTIQEAKAARQRELELERERKAALMDYLFSYGTKGEPRKQTEIGEIPDSWEVMSLKKVLVDVIDYRGRTPKKLGGHFSAEGIPVISAKNVKNGALDFNEGIRYVSPEMYERWMSKKLREGDVLLTSEAPLGKVILLTNESNYCLGQRLYGLRVDSTKLYPHFFYFLLTSESVQRQLQAKATGTTAKGIKQSELLQVNVKFPSLSEQRTIADVLQAIDKKIETLEQEGGHLDELFHAMLDELMTGQRSAVPLIDSELLN